MAGPDSYKVQIGVQFVGEVPSLPQSSKVGHLPFKQENAGSNPVCGTKMLPWSKGWARDYGSRLCRFESYREPQYAPSAGYGHGLLSQVRRVQFLHGAPVGLVCGSEPSGPNRRKECSTHSKITKRACGGTGRRGGLKTRCPRREGSNPSMRTIRIGSSEVERRPLNPQVEISKFSRSSNMPTSSSGKTPPS